MKKHDARKVPISAEAILRSPGRETHQAMALMNVCFSARYGLRPDIAACPKSASCVALHCGKTARRGGTHKVVTDLPIEA
jgi:hypothetical protein